MTPLLLTVFLLSPSAVVRVAPSPTAEQCPASLEKARDLAVAASSKAERAVLDGDIISLAALARLKTPGLPILPSVRRAQVAAIDCLVDRAAKASVRNRVDAELALAGARIALAYRQPGEAASRLEFILRQWPQSHAADLARALRADIVVAGEGEQADARDD